jgi:hypothetical protein
MKQLLALGCALVLVLGCGGAGEEGPEEPQVAQPSGGPAIQVEPPEPMPVPDYREPASDTDWAAKVHNKDREIVEVLNIINPVAAYITAGFERYGDRFSPTLHEEWQDTQAQLTSAMTLYEDCKARVGAGELDRQLFLDLEDVWQRLVKTGVAGVRAKSMVDAEVSKVTG